MSKAGRGAGGEGDISNIPLWSEEDIYRLCIKHEGSNRYNQQSTHTLPALAPKYNILYKCT